MRLRPKSYQIINQLVAEHLEGEYTQEDIDRIVDFQFEVLHTYMSNPIKGKILIKNLGVFEIQANRLVAFLKRRVENFRKNKAEGKEYPPAQVKLFRILWKLRHIATEYVATKKRYIKGFYKPVDLRTGEIIPKKSKK